MNNNFINNNLIEETNVAIIVDSNGKTMEEAINNIFVNLRKTIYSKVNGYLVHMIPEKVILKDYKMEERTERFLGLFLPQKKTKYTIMVEVEVKVKFIRNIK